MSSASQLYRKFKDMPYNSRQGLVILGLIIVLISIPVTISLIRQNPQLTSKAATNTFLETFDGDPTSPQLLGGLAYKNILPNWDIQVHSRNQDTWDNLELQDNVSHGADCSAPPATHTNDTYEGAVFNCKNHIMTAENASGYGLIALTPNNMLDFSNGGVVQFDMSTLAMSGRDWVDVWITPFLENTTLPFDEGFVDLQGPPKDAIHAELNTNSSEGNWIARVVKNYDENQYNSPDGSLNIANGIVAGTNQAQTRQTFKITVTRTHVKMERLASSTATAVTYFDLDIPDVGFTQGVVQFAQHSYNPYKDNSGAAGTWHWDNVMISPAVPFTMIHADKRRVFWNQNSEPGDAGSIRFDQPAPANSYIRFSAVGTVLYSLDGGTTWQTAPKQLSGTGVGTAPYFFPIPQGTQNVAFRLNHDDWYTCNFGCQAKDFGIFSQTASGGGTTCTKQADLNCDGLVNILDMSILLSKWNTTDATADINHDGKVSVFDLSILLSKWGS